MRAYDINKKILDKLDDIAVAINPESNSVDVDLSHTRNYDNDDAYVAKLTKIENAIINGSHESENIITELCYLKCADDAGGPKIPGKATLAQYNEYNEYLSYNSGTKKFDVIKDFTAIITGWVYSYSRSTSTYSEGEFYKNSNKLASYKVDSLGPGAKAGTTVITTVSAGDTIYPYTPNNNGWPQQNLKIYLSKPTIEVTDAMKSYTDEGGT